MRSRVLSPVSLVAALAAGSALAADPAATVRTARLTDNLYALTATTTNPAGSTLLALVGGDDILGTAMEARGACGSRHGGKAKQRDGDRESPAGE